MSVPLRIVPAARELGREPRTLQRWVRKGCPHTRDSRGPLFDVEAVLRWREGADRDALAAVARALWKLWKRDAGEGVPAWRSLALREGDALALLVLSYDAIATELGLDSSALPDEMRHLVSRFVHLRRGRANHDSGRPHLSAGRRGDDDGKA